MDFGLFRVKARHSMIHPKTNIWPSACYTCEPPAQ